MQLSRVSFSPAFGTFVQRHATKVFLALVLVVLAWVVWGVHTIYQARQNQYRHNLEHELHLINQWQTERIVQWREQRQADANALSEDALLAQALAQWHSAPNPQRQELLTGRLRILQEQARYSAVYLVDSQGQLLLNAQGRAQGHMPQAEQMALQNAFTLALACFVEPRHDAFFAFPFFSILAPIFQGATPIGAVWLVSDVRMDLFPLMEKWPTSSQSAESALISQSGNEVLFLSPLRHRKNAELAFRVSTKHKHSPVVQAVEGARGVFYGQDYRSIPVMAAASAVPGTAWFLVSKIDTSEAFADVKINEALALSLPLSLGLLCAGLIFAMLQRRGRLREKGLKLELQRNMQWLEGAQKAALIGSFSYDPRSNNITLSTMACTIFGLEGHDTMQLSQWIQLLLPEDRSQVLEIHKQAMVRRQPLQTQYCICRANDQQIRWVQMWAAYEVTTTDNHRHSRHITGTVQDITERKQIEQDLADYRAVLEQKIRLDPLTQIANRRALDEHIHTQWQRTMRHQRPMSLLMIDIDHFKRYNDHYGHVQGDECLKRVAHALAAMVSRADELVARYGGEEFAALLPETPAPQALALAQKMCSAVFNLGIAHADSPTASCVTISIGVASVRPVFHSSKQGYGQGPMEPQILFEQADAALYAAKHQGRSRAVLHSTLPSRATATV